MAFNQRYKPANVCKFENCINYKKMSCGGYCEEHKEHDPGFERKQAKEILKKELPKIKMLSLGIMDNKLVNNYGATEFQLLQNWFGEVAREIAKNPICWECRLYIPPQYYRAATAHILPKKIFLSIATHPLNYLILCAKNGCHDKTHRLDQFQKMQCFPEAVRRFMIFYPEIKEKNKLLNEFIDMVVNFQPT